VRIRIRFSKQGKLRWISHRDVARVWERALRRAEVPVAYSAGFSPHPRVSFGLALPTGAESLAEYLDVDLEGQAAPYPSRLTAALPSGMEVGGTAPLEPVDASLQHAVVACDWQIEVGGTGADSPGPAVQRFLDSPAVVVTRERKGHEVTDDIRPSVLELQADGPLLTCRLATQLDGQPRGLRPAELLTALGFDPAAARVLRTHQWIVRDGAWCEPVPAVDAPARQGACDIRRDPTLNGTDLGGPDVREPHPDPAGSTPAFPAGGLHPVSAGIPPGG
jgi:radical SAM-linked protein